MAIQMRRGLKKDFDPAKMLPGEWAVAIDSETQSQIVWMCFAPGVVKRMGTYEDFLERIKEATGDIRDEYIEKFNTLIEEAGDEIVIEFRGKIAEEYLPEIEAYVTQAENAKTAAGLSEANSKGYESFAKNYYELTKTLSIANVGDITFSLDAERNCLVATFMDDTEEAAHDWYSKFLAFLTEYAEDVKARQAETTKQADAAAKSATAASGSANTAQKAATDATTAKTAAQKALTDTQATKTAAETSLNGIADAAEENLNGIVSAAEESLGGVVESARTDMNGIKTAAESSLEKIETSAEEILNDIKTSAATNAAKAEAAASEAEALAQEVRTLSTSNVGDITFMIDGKRNCLTATYTE